MNDEFDKQVRQQLLPWEFFSCETADEAAWEKKVDEIAATLRKQAWINDAVYQGMAKEIADLRAECDQLKAQLAEGERRGIERAVDVLRDRLQKYLEHRKNQSHAPEGQLHCEVERCIRDISVLIEQNIRPSR